MESIEVAWYLIRYACHGFYVNLLHAMFICKSCDSCIFDCTNVMLTKWFPTARLETRTKESSMEASVRVANPCAKWKWMFLKWNWGGNRLVHHRPVMGFGPRSEYEFLCWDPKDGELCVIRAKPGETLVEARRGSDVQIDPQSCV